MSLVKRIKRAGKVLIIGNGGSYANAEHIANDLLSVGIRAFSPNMAFLTATANDKEYAVVFSRWLQVVAEKGDLLLALSGSGTSKNIVDAMQTAKRIGMDAELITWHLKDGMDMEMSEEAMLTLGHAWKKELRGRR